MDLSVWLSEGLALVQGQPLVAMGAGVVMLVLLYWQTKLLIKLVLAIAVVLVLIYVVDAAMTLSSKGTAHKSDMIREDRY